jgi:hypothetical protein
LLYLFLLLVFILFPLAAKSPLTRMLFVFYVLVVIFNASRLVVGAFVAAQGTLNVHIPLIFIGLAVFAFFSVVVMAKTLEEIYGTSENMRLIGFVISYVSMAPASVAWVMSDMTYPCRAVLEAAKKRIKKN